MEKLDALMRLEKIAEAVSWLTDDFVVTDVWLDYYKHKGPAVHIDRYQYDCKDETALEEYGKVCNYPTERIENYTKHYDGVVVHDPNGVVLFQLVNLHHGGEQDG